MAIDCNTYVAQIDDLTDLVSFLDWTYGVKTFCLQEMPRC